MEETKPRPYQTPVIIESQPLLLPDDLWLPVLSHFDVKTLIEKKQVCRSWRVTCTEAIDAKQTSTTKKAFSTNPELRAAVLKYCGWYARARFRKCDPQDVEEFAKTYGYPINKWDVSDLQNFESIFFNMRIFNEDISMWNVSHATSMRAMFCRAGTFNQDLSSWNVSNVTDTSDMFHAAFSFNQNLSRWDVSNIRNMMRMFLYATSFDGDISNWNVENVTNMSRMFQGASSFNQKLSRWNVANVRDMSGMFDSEIVERRGKFLKRYRLWPRN
jgi:surface protein